MGFNLSKEIKDNNIGLTEKTTEMSASLVFIETKAETKETFKKNNDGSFTKVGQSETKSDIGVAESSQKIESTLGASLILGAEVSINWNKVAEGVNELIKSIKE
ncbi:hypothetical protein CLV62_13631 [Dysgonomonas alginatilytica]|uniref:Uncharacterized protein n=1 Tax=Dysgonomonas alginatilytica TaxID=1605892 RepID=A0A2V3PIG1_9BACT|nr:hypothetical protein [Dysgonomonas alginatilytica]PXV59410.1 hypothetical protein CLV62_13631 [Dysgonomonas alginatilytica]